MKLPIVIIVDELDRCRPTYAIKVLEEIKHLFDVPGVAFLLGLHGRQLEHSVTAAYGGGFDGSAYLRRFFSRRYALRSVSLQPLVQRLIDTLSIKEDLLHHPSVMRRGSGRVIDLPKAELITDYLSAYGLAARDAFGILESLHTAMALTRGSNVQLSYLLPLIICRDLVPEGLGKPLSDPGWTLAFYADSYGQEIKEYPLGSFIEHIHAAAKMEDTDLSQRLNAGDIYARIIGHVGFRNGSTSYHLMQNYPDLVRTVARFS